MKFDPSRSNTISWFIEVTGAKLEETHPRLILSSNEVGLVFTGKYTMTEQGPKVVFDVPPLDKWLGETVVEGRIEVMVGATQCLPVWSDQVTLERVIRARVGESVVVSSEVSHLPKPSTSQPEVRPTVTVRQEPVVEEVKTKEPERKVVPKKEETVEKPVVVNQAVSVDAMLEFVRKGGSVRDWMEGKW